MKGVAPGGKEELPRVLMVSPQFHPAVGGYERAALRLSLELAKRGHDVTVLAERREKAWPASETMDGVRIIRHGCIPKRGVHALTAGFTLVAYLALRGRRHDVWHVHQYGISAAVASGMGMLLRRPVVLKLTSSEVYSITRAFSGHPLRWPLEFLHRRISAVFSVTKETTREALAFGFAPERIRAVPNGVDTGIFAPGSPREKAALKERLGIPYAGVALYVGRLSPEKNPLGLVRAWALAKPRLGAGWGLVIVGDGPERNALEEAVASLGPEGGVMLAGSSKEVEAWMGAADLYVLPSFVEGLSNTLLEAMACGLPVLTTRVSGADDLVGATGAGLVVDVSDSQAMADAFIRLTGSPELREEMGKRARRTIEDGYSLEATATKHVAVYRELVPRLKG